MTFFTCPPIRGTTQIVGVFGFPVAHSASPPMHNAAFAALGLDWAYMPFAVAPEQIGEALGGVRALNLRGVNVTVPLKELVQPFLEEITPRAQIIGSVNTITRDGDRLLGDSTDGPGFLAALKHAGQENLAGKTVVVLGAGGSARAVVHALLEARARVVIANRGVERAGLLANNLGQFGEISVVAWTETAIGAAVADATVLVNTTSVGMHPRDNEMPPVPASALHPNLLVSDLIYNPAQTRLLRLARAHGCRTQNGVEMLVRQGALSFARWTGHEPSVDVMRAAVEATLTARRSEKAD